MKNDSTELHFFAEVKALLQRNRALIFLLMRISVVNLMFLFSCTCVAYSIPAKGQSIESTYVELAFDNVPIESVFDAIEEQTNFSFSVPTHKINTSKYKVSLEARTYTVKDALDLVLEGTGIRYEQNEGFIYIFFERGNKNSPDVKKNAEVKIEHVENYSATLITGTVKDAATGEPLAGVNIIVKGTTKGTTTDVEGKFGIEAEDNDVLVFSFIGFKSFETAIGGRSNIEVSMEVDITALKEIEVNAGYWKVAEREKTGNISKITAEQIRSQPITNPLQALQGRAAGVYIEQFTGLPGGGFRVRIRGQNSLRPDANEPLYIVDGVPFTSTTLHSGIATSANSQLASPSPLNSINPNDIESIEILKDADATAIYGSRGANGVILITTKRAKAEKTKVDFSFSSGFGQVPKMLDLLNTGQWMEMRNEAFRNDGTSPQPYDHDMNGNWDTTRYTDWQKVLIGGTANYTNGQVSISGGNEYTQFIFGSNYYKETTVYPGSSSYQRGSSHFNMKHTTENKKVAIDLLVNYSTDKNTLPQSDLTTLANSLQPVAPPIFDENGQLNWQKGTWINPYSAVLKEYTGKTDLLHSNTILTYRPIDGLSLRGNLSYITMRMDEVSLQPKKANDPAFTSTAVSRFGEARDKKLTIEPQIDYVRSIGRGKISVSVGGTFLQSNYESLQLAGTGYTNDALIKSFAAAPNKVVFASPLTEYRYVSGFARMNYVLEDRYIINVTGRRDGSSRFGPDKQFANFGAIGVAWIFSDEKYIQEHLEFLTFGKIRSSYGSTGNDQIPDYGFLDTYSPTSYPYGGIAGLIPTRLVNTDFSWETTNKFEAAIEVGLLTNRILMSASYYNNRSSNQLVGFPLPLITGQSSIQFNLPAEIENSGWEFDLNSTILQLNSFEWSASANFTFPRSLLIRYPNIESSSYANQYTTGKSLNLKKTFDFTGIDPATGIPTFNDVDQNGSISAPNDLLAINDTDREFYGGLNNSFSFKGITLDVFVQFVKQNSFNYLNTFGVSPGAGWSNQPAIVMNRWQESGDVTDIPRFMNNIPNYSNLPNSDFAITDASFVRLKNVSVSWKLPPTLVQRIKLDNARVFVQGQNLFTFSNYLGRDPEVGFSSTLPALRVITAGLSISL